MSKPRGDVRVAKIELDEESARRLAEQLGIDSADALPTKIRFEVKPEHLKLGTDGFPFWVGSVT